MSRHSRIRLHDIPDKANRRMQQHTDPACPQAPQADSSRYPRLPALRFPELLSFVCMHREHAPDQPETRPTNLTRFQPEHRPCWQSLEVAAFYARLMLREKVDGESLRTSVYVHSLNTSGNIQAESFY